MRFTVCVLLYGDYPALADRVLGSLWQHARCGAFSVRLGCNAISDATLEVVRSYVAEWCRRDLLASNQVYVSGINIRKYPMMRCMFYERQPVLTPYVMWFDDDSWILPTAPANWFSRVETAIQHADMIGSIWRRALRPGQQQWIVTRPWYAGKPVAVGNAVDFVTGGWWCIKTGILQRWNWPDPAIGHNGGDQMLGMLCRQQGYRMAVFDEHLAINADESGKCSSAKRRGLSEPLVGEQ